MSYYPCGLGGNDEGLEGWADTITNLISSGLDTVNNVIDSSDPSQQQYGSQYNPGYPQPGSGYPYTGSAPSVLGSTSGILLIGAAVLGVILLTRR